MALNEEQRRTVEKILNEVTEDQDFLAEVQKKTDQSMYTMIDMMMSGVSPEDALEIVSNAILNNVIQDSKE